MRHRTTLLAALAIMLAPGMSSQAQQASGPPTSITPPPSVYNQPPPSLPPPRTITPRIATPRATAPRAAAAQATTPQATMSQATATNAAAIVHATAPGSIDCGAQLVVWANPATHIYHFSTSDYYGHTKIGSYMCENDAKAEGMRPGRTEVRP